MGRAVVPLVRARLAVIGKLIAYGRPGFAAVVGAMHDLAEPVTGLRSIDAIGIGWRAFHVIDFQAAEVGAVHLPLFTFLVGGQDERAFTRAH